MTFLLLALAVKSVGSIEPQILAVHPDVVEVVEFLQIGQRAFGGGFALGLVEGAVAIGIEALQQLVAEDLVEGPGFGQRDDLVAGEHEDDPVVDENVGMRESRAGQDQQCQDSQRDTGEAAQFPASLV